MKFISLALAHLVVVSAHLTVYAQSPVGRVNESWDKAVVYLPNTETPTTIDKISASLAGPVLLYFHGCDGIPGGNGENHSWAKAFAKQGMLVVMPDSLARSDRANNPQAVMCKQMPAVYDMRLDEIAFSTKQVRAQPWFDGKNLFVMGWSEGAISVARTKIDGYSGVIAASWTCTHKSDATWDGVFLPLKTPVLTMQYEEDPQLQNEYIKGNCTNKFGGRADAANVTLTGRGHRAYSSEKARDAANTFVTRLTSK